ncbi:MULTISPECIES: NAD(P)-dependent oxidoreductase [unclassified Duganella]|uniref:NAD-dependent epimerase/dehydratase family protein n=1 Tax=unclassified Duganella TaxID=2636909 RepID=UPI000E3579D5|nr:MULTISPECIES: NAD(P)-dependent oxidoreductase [unclassified Duganella]RFP18716.1 NAD(P)-dependent oxidoreductase [Duganella sp. BJB475]RFP35381.1 NAD(P)-dependent oxidoreductase [Duganella sp. BJB476]
MSDHPKPFQRLLLTGAAGGLGRVLRPHLGQWAEVVRLSDLDGLGQAGPGEEIVHADLADRGAMLRLLDGVDAVLHFGGISVEAGWNAILQANIVGVHHLYEAAHAAGVRRVVFASSNHAIGFHPTTTQLDADSPTRPDGLYGVSKCFGEQLARFYYDRFGLETVCLRIGSAFPQPATRRMMVTYLHYEDLIELIRCSLFAPRVGHTIAYGMSDNDALWWNNSKAAHLGYRPRHSSRVHAHLFPDSAAYPAADDRASQYQGGPFVSTGPFYD